MVSLKLFTLPLNQTKSMDASAGQFIPHAVKITDCINEKYDQRHFYLWLTNAYSLSVLGWIKDRCMNQTIQTKDCLLKRQNL